VSAVGKLAWGAVLAGAAAFALQGGEYATTDLLRQRARERELTASVDSLQRAVDSLRVLERRLRTDPVLQESVAREEFGMVRGERELLYRFADRPDSAARDSARDAARAGVDGRH
jgi:cell division protein FtsB